MDRLRIIGACGATVALLIDGERAHNGGWQDPHGGQFTEAEQRGLYDFAYGTGQAVYIGADRIDGARLVWGDASDARGHS